MRKKKVLILPCLTAVAFAAYLCLKTFGASTRESNSLLMENVEALASNETSSSEINCDASNKKRCLFYCGLCNRSIKGSGATVGSHSCTK